eukprot:NODE_2000_length_525_cov_213.721393_g1985_i0.p1 GENE.NODE_2000_length_525_cov_213.721393_g1985_i0~~NODE_2000_length_525_cov_213.721393_g1985_i0.p1  ORF type:complete len:151 (-),score=10.60 NODE_2000_length_525_cov_213.721393_g1985_i0:73-525(-)
MCIKDSINAEYMGAPSSPETSVFGTPPPDTSDDDFDDDLPRRLGAVARRVGTRPGAPRAARAESDSDVSPPSDGADGARRQRGKQKKHRQMSTIASDAPQHYGFSAQEERCMRQWLIAVGKADDAAAPLANLVDVYMTACSAVHTGATRR